jgi:hypothetical protein
MNMPRWTKTDVEKLRKLVEEKEPSEVIAAKLERSVDAVKMKAKRLGLNVVVGSPGKATTTKLKIPRELPSVQEALKILAAALKAAAEPGLDNTEIQRLQVVATLARTYESLLANFMRYRDIEKRLVELEVKYARLAKQKA